ncbi:MAG: TetR family transcriptional regulator [Deltaproteobacteria bacterium]|nr:TetR family transcriptional regulator [Deltaproteobacteria bacterium]
MLEDKRTAIARQAARLFLESGYEATSMKQLADATGMAHPGIYHYFRSKEDLLENIHRQAAWVLNESLIPGLRGGDAPRQKIERLIETTAALLAGSDEIRLLLLQARVPKRIARRAEAGAKEVIGLLRGVLKDLFRCHPLAEPVDATVAAFSLVGMTSWIARWYKSDGRLGLDQLTGALKRLFLYGYYGGEVGDVEEEGGLPELPAEASLAGEKKELIARKTADLFSKRGYENATMQQIARAAGTSASGLYHYFRNKEEILLSLYDIGATLFDRCCLQEAARVEDAEVKIRLHIRNVLHLLTSHKEVSLFLLEDSSPKAVRKSADETARSFVRSLRADLVRLAAEKGLRDPVDPTVAAFSLVGMISWTLRWYDPNGPLDLRALSGHVTRLFLNGVTAGGAGSPSEALLGEVPGRRSPGRLAETATVAGGRCPSCGRVYYPKREGCLYCPEEGLEEVELIFELPASLNAALLDDYRSRTRGGH